MNHRTAAHGLTMPHIQLRGETPAQMLNNNTNDMHGPKGTALEGPRRPPSREERTT